MGTMAIMGGHGDTKLIWSADSADEVANAKRTFDDLKKMGYLAYSVSQADGGKGIEMKTFDANAEKVILAPRMAGGQDA